MEMSDDPKFHLVSEGAGIVRRVGPDVAKVRVGDRVLFVGTGAISTITKAAEQLFEVLPESISFVEGAGIPLDFMTAIYSIIHIGRLEKEQAGIQLDLHEHANNPLSLSSSTAAVKVSVLLLFKSLNFSAPKSMQQSRTRKKVSISRKGTAFRGIISSTREMFLLTKN
jgi:hypothetical protein